MKIKGIITFTSIFLYMIKLMRICCLTLAIFSSLQKTNTHTIQGIEKIMLLSKHHLTQQLTERQGYHIQKI